MAYYPPDMHLSQLIVAYGEQVLAPAKKPSKITALKFGQVVMRAHLSIDALSLKKAQAVIGGR
ncbi:hypothetical protein C2W62_53925, partial [Candidatus Entotheonella serta]